MRRDLVLSLIPIYVTNLVDALGYSLLIPLLPIVAERFGAVPVVAGSLLSTPAFVGMLAAPFWGKLSDSLGRKNMIVAAEVFSCTSNLMLALSNSLPLFFGSRIVAGLGIGGGGALDEAFIADVTTDKERNQAYAIYGAVYGVAFVIGPLVARVLVRYGIGSPFFLAAGLSLLNIYLSWRFIPSQTASRTAKTSMLASLAAIRSPDVRRLISCHFLFIFAVICFLANFALYFERILPHQSRLDASFFLASAAVVGGATIVFVEGRVAKRVGEKAVALVGLALDATAYALLTFVSDPFLLGIALMLWAAGAAFTQPALTALLSERADRQEIGAVMGITDSMYSAGMMAGPIIGSAILGVNAHLLGIVPAFAAALAFVLVDRISTKRGTSPPGKAVPRTFSPT